MYTRQHRVTAVNIRGGGGDRDDHSRLRVSNHSKPLIGYSHQDGGYTIARNSTSSACSA
jgi:hypothetical protein